MPHGFIGCYTRLTDLWKDIRGRPVSLCRYRAKLSIAASIAVTFWRHGTSIAGGDGVIYESGGSVSRRRRRRFIGSRSVERWRCSRFNDRIGVEGNGDIEDANKSGIPVKVVFAQLAVYDGRWMDGWMRGLWLVEIGKR